MIIKEKFEVHEQLNPKIWGKDNKMLPEVSLKLKETVE